MHRPILPAIIAVVCLATQLPAQKARAQVTFGAPVAVDDTRPAGEPGIIVDAQGRIFVNAPGGLPGPSAVWRSTNGGSSFTFKGPGAVGASPNGAGIVIGGGDSNLASDAASNLYFIDLWLGSSSSAASQNHGDNWFGQPLASVPVQDRPWVSADPDPTRAGTVYTVTEQLGTGVFLSKSSGLSQLSGVVYPVSILEV